MGKLVEKELYYEITGFCFKVQGKLGRFAKEIQYADELEKLFSSASLEYEREFLIQKLIPDSPKETE